MSTDLHKEVLCAVCSLGGGELAAGGIIEASIWVWQQGGAFLFFGVKLSFGLSIEFALGFSPACQHACPRQLPSLLAALKRAASMKVCDAAFASQPGSVVDSIVVVSKTWAYMSV